MQPRAISARSPCNREVGDRVGQAKALNNLGELLTHSAASGHAQALTIARQVGSPLEEARALEGIGRWQLRSANPGEGATHLRQALALYQRIGSPDRQRVQDALDHHSG